MANYKRIGKVVIALLVVINLLLLIRTTHVWTRNTVKLNTGTILGQNTDSNVQQQNRPVESIAQVPVIPVVSALTDTKPSSNSEPARVDILNSYGNAQVKDDPTPLSQSVPQVSETKIDADKSPAPSAPTPSQTDGAKQGGMPDDLNVVGPEVSGGLPGHKDVEALEEQGSQDNPLADDTIVRADKILAQFGKNTDMGFALHRYHGGYRIPYAIIIGGARCGTNQLAAFLALHPKIYLANGQINFFNNKSNYAKGLEWYGTQMPKNVPAEGVIIERSPGYFYSDEAPKRIQAMNATIKLILAVRNPVRRTLSEYAQYVAKAKMADQPVPAFEQLMVEQRSKLINTENLAVLRSIYHAHLSKWHKYFSKEQMLVVDGDAFIKNPFGELKKVEEFIGLPHLITEDKLYFNSTSSHFCALKDGKPSCYHHLPTWQEPNVDHNVVEKLALFYKHHNQKFYNLIGDRLEW